MKKEKGPTIIKFFSNLAFGTIFMGAAAVSTSVTASQIPDHIVIEKQPPFFCLSWPEIGPAHIIFDQHTNVLGGWSHIYDDPDSFPGLRRDPGAYRIDSTNVSRDAWCPQSNVYKAILVKKYADWDRQHANGLVSTFEEKEITFGGLKDIVLDLKINSRQTYIPSKMDYLSTYGSYTDINNLLEMDQGMINLGITLYGENDADQSIETFQGMINLELNQYEYSNQWLHIVIPAESLWYFVQKDYANTEKDPADYLTNKIIGLRITPETHNTKVLRNYIPDAFNDSIPESYKELGVSIRKLAVRLKEDNQFWWGENPLYSGHRDEHNDWHAKPLMPEVTK